MDDDELREEVEQLRNEVERLTQERKQKFVNQSESQQVPGDPGVSRRKFLKTMAGSVAGAGILGMLPAASGFTIRSPSDFSFFGGENKALNVDMQGKVTADSIDLGQGAVSNIAGNNLSIDNSGNLNASSGTGGYYTTDHTEHSQSDRVIVAEDASEIQPAIDALTEETDYSGSPGRHGSHLDYRGGIVQLLPKAYYPEDTIVLKRGVIVQGAGTPNYKWLNRRNEEDEGTGTVIFTSELPTGSGYSLDPANGAHTYRHFDTVGDHRDYKNGELTDAEKREVSHPHLPVFVWQNHMPVFSEEPMPEEVERTFGNNAGIRNMLLFADEQRWWDPSNESAGSKREKEATYFGVYDALLMENVGNTVVQNINTANFLGYNGFYQDAVNVRSIGNHYGVNGVGSATDYHGSTLTLDYSFTVYVKRGMWNVDVTGPTPTVKGSGHLSQKFVGDGPAKGVITGKSPTFLGTEADYDAGNAPIVEPSKKNVVFNHVDQHTEMWDYTITGRDSSVGTLVHVDDNKFRAWDCTFATANDIFDISVGGVWIRGSKISNYDRHAFRCSNHIPHLVSDTLIRGNNGSVAIWADNTTNPHGSFKDCVFTGDTVFDYSNGTPDLAVDDCNFLGINTMFQNGQSTGWNGSLRIADPQGYVNENGGSVTKSGDGSSTSFSFPHGMDETPEWYNVQPASADADGTYYVTADGTNIVIHYENAPPNATNNLTWVWTAKGWSAPGIAAI